MRTKSEIVNLAISGEMSALADELIYFNYALLAISAIEVLELPVEIEEDLLSLAWGTDKVATLLIAVTEVNEDNLELAEGTISQI